MATRAPHNQHVPLPGGPISPPIIPDPQGNPTEISYTSITPSEKSVFYRKHARYKNWAQDVADEGGLATPESRFGRAVGAHSAAWESSDTFKTDSATEASTMMIERSKAAREAWRKPVPAVGSQESKENGHLDVPKTNGHRSRSSSPLGQQASARTRPDRILAKPLQPSATNSGKIPAGDYTNQPKSVSARAQRDAYISSALNLPLEMLSETDQPPPHPPTASSKLTAGRLASLLGIKRTPSGSQERPTIPNNTRKPARSASTTTARPHSHSQTVRAHRNGSAEIGKLSLAQSETVGSIPAASVPPSHRDPNLTVPASSALLSRARSKSSGHPPPASQSGHTAQERDAVVKAAARPSPPSSTVPPNGFSIAPTSASELPYLAKAATTPTLVPNGALGLTLGTPDQPKRSMDRLAVPNQDGVRSLGSQNSQRSRAGDPMPRGRKPSRSGRANDTVRQVGSQASQQSHLSHHPEADTGQSNAVRNMGSNGSKASRHSRRPSNGLLQIPQVDGATVPVRSLGSQNSQRSRKVVLQDVDHLTVPVDNHAVRSLGSQGSQRRRAPPAAVEKATDPPTQQKRSLGSHASHQSLSNRRRTETETLPTDTEDASFKSIPQPAVTTHRQLLPLPRPSLSRVNSVDALRRRHRDPSSANLPARFEPAIYPLPPSGDTSGSERHQGHEHGQVSMSDHNHSKKAYTGIQKTHGQSSHHPGNLAGNTIVYARHSNIHIGSPDRHPIELSPARAHNEEIHDRSPPNPSRDSHQRQINRQEHGRHHDSPDAARIIALPHAPPTATDISEADHFSFEVPSGTRGRLRVSLAWFREREVHRAGRRARLRAVSKSDAGGSDRPPPVPPKSPPSLASRIRGNFSPRREPRIRLTVDDPPRSPPPRPQHLNPPVQPLSRQGSQDRPVHSPQPQPQPQYPYWPPGMTPMGPLSPQGYNMQHQMRGLAYPQPPAGLYPGWGRGMPIIGPNGMPMIEQFGQRHPASGGRQAPPSPPRPPSIEPPSEGGSPPAPPPHPLPHGGYTPGMMGMEDRKSAHEPGRLAYSSPYAPYGYNPNARGPGFISRLFGKGYDQPENDGGDVGVRNWRRGVEPGRAPTQAPNAPRKYFYDRQDRGGTIYDGPSRFGRMFSNGRRQDGQEGYYGRRPLSPPAPRPPRTRPILGRPSGLGLNLGRFGRGIGSDGRRWGQSGYRDMGRERDRMTVAENYSTVPYVDRRESRRQAKEQRRKEKQARRDRRQARSRDGLPPDSGRGHGRYNTFGLRMPPGLARQTRATKEQGYSGRGRSEGMVRDWVGKLRQTGRQPGQGGGSTGLGLFSQNGAQGNGRKLSGRKWGERVRRP